MHPLNRWRVAGTGLVLGVLLVIELFLLIRVPRPLPALSLHSKVASSIKTASGSGLDWPSDGDAALEVVGQGVLTSSNSPLPLPMASTAKLMTSLVVLERHPLKVGQPGPRLRIGAEEVREYQQESAVGESVLPVTAGEQLSEYQALQALLLPSANNVAAILARWSFGSTSAAITQMNALAGKLGLHSTYFADVSGFNPDTVSIPSDLVKLGEVALQNPVLASIVNLTEATLPVAGQVINVNHLLGVAGIVGIKTGNTTRAGGCYVFAAPYSDSGSSPNPLLIGAVMGAGNLEEAMNSGLQLLRAARNSLAPKLIVRSGDVVGSLETAWGDKADLVASQSLELLLLPGTTLQVGLQSSSPRMPGPIGQEAAKLVVTSNQGNWEIPLQASKSLSSPNLGWRLFG